MKTLKLSHSKFSPLTRLCGVSSWQRRKVLNHFVSIQLVDYFWIFKMTRMTNVSEWEKDEFKLLLSTTLINAFFVVLLRHFRRKLLDRNQNEFRVWEFSFPIIVLLRCWKIRNITTKSLMVPGGMRRRAEWRFWAQSSKHKTPKRDIRLMTRPALPQWHTNILSISQLCWNKWKNSFQFS